VTFGLTRGEIILIAFIFALVYGAGFLPKLTALLSGSAPGKPGKPTDE
jgi:Sec-independent protein translocase protein TatA